jgi:hypothetical protein
MKILILLIILVLAFDMSGRIDRMEMLLAQQTPGTAEWTQAQAEKVAEVISEAKKNYAEQEKNQ